jgi:hypothetical protein
MFLLTSGQPCEPVVYQLMWDCCIVVSWKVGAQVTPVQSFPSLYQLFQSVRVHRFIGGFFGSFSGEGTVGSSCVRALPYEGVAAGESELDRGGSFVVKRQCD